jgi:hypothetical protein
VRNAVSLGGDTDTMACIAGAIAEAFYGGVPAAIAERVLAALDDRLRGVVEEFLKCFGGGGWRGKRDIPTIRDESDAAANRPHD